MHADLQIVKENVISKDTAAQETLYVLYISMSTLTLLI